MEHSTKFNAASAQSTRAWHREPLVWMLWAVPGSAVVMGIAMLVVAIESYDGVVADDYYQRGLDVGQRLERDRRAADLQLRAAIEFDPHQRRASVSLTSAKDPSGAAPRLALSHATRSGKDKVLELREVAPGSYAGNLPELEAGRWYLSLGNAAWRLTGTLDGPLVRVTSLELRPAEP